MSHSYVSPVSSERPKRNGMERNTLLMETTWPYMRLAVYESEMQAELMHGRRKRKPAMHSEHERPEPDPIMRAGSQS